MLKIVGQIIHGSILFTLELQSRYRTFLTIPTGHRQRKATVASAMKCKLTHCSTGTKFTNTKSFLFSLFCSMNSINSNLQNPMHLIIPLLLHQNQIKFVL